MTHLHPLPAESPPSRQEPSERQGPPPRSALPGGVRFPVTYGLLAFTVLVYLAQSFSVWRFAGIDLIAEWGAKDRALIMAGQVWRVVTPLFIHAGLLHLLVNMYSLFALGRAVERFFGRWRMLAFYLLAGLAGVGLSLFFSPNPSVGASGAIFGMLGALAAFLYRHRLLFGGAGMLQFRNLIIVAMLNLALGFAPRVDNWAHLGGLVCGAMLGWKLGPRLEALAVTKTEVRLVDRLPWRASWRSVLLTAVMLLVLTLAASMSPLGN